MSADPIYEHALRVEIESTREEGGADDVLSTACHCFLVRCVGWN